MIRLTTEQAQQIEEALYYGIMSSGGETGCNHSCNICFCKENKALATIRAARAQEQAEQEPVAVKCGCREGCQYCQGSGWILANAAPVEPVKQEPVGVFANVNALTPEKGTRWEQMVDSAHDGVKYIHLYAAPVSAKCEWVDLTDDEIGAVMDFGYATDSELENAHAVIAAFKDKNK